LATPWCIFLAKYPGIPFDEARAKAHELLNTAAKSRVYRGPVVLSAEELAKSKSRLERAFGRQGNRKQLSKTTIPGDSSYSVKPSTSGLTWVNSNRDA